MKLYTHQQNAISNAMSLIEAGNQRVAVVAPTGSGKTLTGLTIARNLAQGRKILWVTTRDFIFERQKRSIQRLIGPYELEDVMPVTYPALAQAFPDVDAGCIVLDEFHHIGAPVWGNGVEQLCEKYQGVPVVGLSATPYRPSDGNRDIGEEFFDGCYAERMYIWDAWADPEIDILPPKYVCGMYSWDDEVAVIERKLANNPDLLDDPEAKKAYENMRRAVEEAEGIETLLSKNLPDPQGHYLVFCRDLNHLEKMTETVEDWLRMVNPCVHTYRVTYKDEGSLTTLDAFSNDESNALKAMFAVDMLNEGLHCDCDGVIMARPTGSSTVFMQQLGRAMEVGSKKTKVVIDLVNNIDSLNFAAVGAAGLRNKLTEAIERQRKERGEGYEGPVFEITGSALNTAEVFAVLGSRLEERAKPSFRLANVLREHPMASMTDAAEACMITLSQVSRSWAEACELAGVEDIRSKKGFKDATIAQLAEFLHENPFATMKEAAAECGI
ncbi:MAG: DEAD/DEAH box helicase family protein, partial [Bacteroidales bacterium]|nr:DEAD/DEAH box helicase family protein [Bacteroidales bacterium]